MSHSPDIKLLIHTLDGATVATYSPNICDDDETSCDLRMINDNETLAHEIINIFFFSANLSDNPLMFNKILRLS